MPGRSWEPALEGVRGRCRYAGDAVSRGAAVSGLSNGTGDFDAERSTGVWRHRRRTGRPGGRVHARRPRLSRRLARAERWLGGKAAVLEEQGYRFDMGPTILTLPSVLRRIFAEAGRRLEDHLELIRLDPQWRCFLRRRLGARPPPGRRGDGGRAVEVLAPGRGRRGATGASSSCPRGCNAISERFFFWRPVGSLRDMFDARSAVQPSMLRALVDMRPGRSVAATVRSMVSDARVAQMLDHFTQYVGSAPDQSPAVLCGIAHMQTDEGVWYPRGGTGAVPRRSGDWRASWASSSDAGSACGASFAILAAGCGVW